MYLLLNSIIVFPAHRFQFAWMENPPLKMNCFLTSSLISVRDHEIAVLVDLIWLVLALDMNTSASISQPLSEM